MSNEADQSGTGPVRKLRRGSKSRPHVYIGKQRDVRLFWRGRVIFYTGPDPEGIVQGSVILSTKCSDPIAAQLKANEYERCAADPDYRSRQDWTLAHAITDYLQAKRNEGIAPATQDAIEGRLGNFARVWRPEMKLHKIDNALVNAYIEQRLSEPIRVSLKGKKNVSRVTIKAELYDMRSALRLAINNGKYHRPTEAVFPPRFKAQARRVERWLTPAQAVVLMQALKPHRAAHVAYMFATGARLKESHRARWEDTIESPEGAPMNGTVWMHGSKTKAAYKEIPISPVTRELFDFARKHAPNQTGKGILFLPWGSPQEALRKVCVRVGLPVVSPNDLRRSFAMWHAHEGVSSTVGMKLMRHTTTHKWETVYAVIRKGETTGKMLAHELQRGEGLNLLALPEAVQNLCKLSENNETRKARLDKRYAKYPQKREDPATLARRRVARFQRGAAGGQPPVTATETPVHQDQGVRNLSGPLLPPPSAAESALSARPGATDALPPEWA